LNYLRRHWFLAVLTLILGLGLGFAQPLEFLTQRPGIRWAVVGIVMFLMALPLALGEFVRTLSRPWGAILASLLNLGLAPALAYPFVTLLGPQLGGGLAVALAAPCTLATAVVWTRRAGGNDVTALTVTVATNLACVVVTPLWLWVLTQQIVGGFSLWDQIQKLSGLVLLPIFLAQMARRWSVLAGWSTQRKAWLGVAAQIGVLYIVFVGTIQSGLAWNAGQSATLIQWSILLFLVAGIHLGLFFLGLWAATWIGLDRREQSAVAISGSQKTFMIGAEMGLSLGLSILPLLIYHLFQLFADTLLADWLRGAGGQVPPMVAHSGAAVPSVGSGKSDKE